MESNEEDGPNDIDSSGDQKQMDNEFKIRLLTLRKMEQRTVHAFFPKESRPNLNGLSLMKLRKMHR